MTITVSPVRFEHHRDALGIGESRPRLSWIVESAPAGWRAASCELERRGGEVVTVVGDESVLVTWPFAALGSRERAEVRVRVTGTDGTSSKWSEWAAVETGLLEASDWEALLVGPVDDTIASPLVRGSFEIRDAAIRRARIYATAHGVYELELNGVRVGDQELAPGWTAYESRLRYQTYDVTSLLAPGENGVGAWLGDGWWRGHLGWDGRKDLYGNQLGVLVQLEIEYADGERQVVASGSDWMAADSPIRSSDLYNGEDFDARRLGEAWSAAGAGAPGWAPVAVRELDVTTLVAPDGPPVRHVETLPVREVFTSPSGKTILDFGQNLVGRLRIRVTGSAGDVITLRHAEVLEHGELATEPLRGARRPTRTRSQVTARRRGRRGSRSTASATPRSTGWPGDLDPAAVDRRACCTPTWSAPAGSRASDPLVDRLHQNVVWGMRGNFLDVPTDCPQRDERLGWTGDLQVFAPTAEYLYDSAGFLTSWLKDLAAEQQRYNGDHHGRARDHDRLSGTDGRVGGCRDRRAVDPLPRLRRPRSAPHAVRQHGRVGRRGRPRPPAQTGCGVPASSSATGWTRPRRPDDPRLRRPTRRSSQPRTSHARHASSPTLRR